MLASWTRLPFQVILLLLSSTSINTKEAPEQPGSPVVPGEPVRRSVVLKGKSHVENFEVLKPVTYELQCTWTGAESKSPNITGFWQRNEAEIENSRVVVALENSQYNLKREFSIVGDETLGHYSCVFDDGAAKIDFIFAVPQMGEVHDKPVVSYVGDSVVLACKMEETKPTPLTWHWYKPNGTDKALINSSLEHRYKIKNAEDQKKTKLVVQDVAQNDSGMYYCGAVYEVGTSLSHTELKVISIMEPLKPFIAIVIEVIILVVLILLYERSGKITPGDTEDGTNTEQTNQLTQGENSETSVRQRKV